MTAQIPDTFLYQTKEYELIGLEGKDLFSPEQFGMEPEMMHAANCLRHGI